MKTDNEKDPEIYELGWWPEVLGVAILVAMIWFLVSLATGEF